ncbi:MAG: peptidoglycan-associated lipoprotein Pal [Deltaproteobacteria bacterium]|nr:peptidoglycan-associated lipoprotein Pal [Deltaproteobacteria bacterium]
MLKKIWIGICLLLILPGLIFITACSKKAMHTEQAAEETAPAMEASAAEQAPVAAVEEKDEEEIYAAKQVVEKEEAPNDDMVAQVFENEDIYFDFDSSALKESAKASLIRKTEWLRANPDASVIIEGHCDERGTEAYNIALGDRRAQSAMAFFVDMGIEASQLSAISYGEERPVDIAKNEEAWAKNRRAHFVID